MFNVMTFKQIHLKKRERLKQKLQKIGLESTGNRMNHNAIPDHSAPIQPFV